MFAGFFIMKLNITIDRDCFNTRLDALVSETVSFCSRSRAVRLIETGEIRVNSLTKKPGYRVRLGDVVTGFIPDSGYEDPIRPETLPINFIYKDAHILVLNKPAGRVVHPAPGNLSGTLVNGLLSFDPDIVNTCEDRFRSGIVHRLDKDTSGLMVVARTAGALTFLQKEFKYRRVKKKYLALVHGVLKNENGRIDLPIGRHPVKRKMMAIRPENGKPAITEWKVQARYQAASRVEIGLKTGRTHQIRVHFYNKGYPLIGDRVYQYKRFRKKNAIAPRQMLHAWKLSFRHPFSGRRMAFQADLPDDFLTVQKKFDQSSSDTAPE